jgi:beta-propeller repeat-containing protein
VAAASVLGLILAAFLLNRSSSVSRSACRIAEPDRRHSTEAAYRQEERESTISSSEKRIASIRALERMPLYFIENRGQLDSRVAYYVQGRDTTLYFTADGMTLVQPEHRHGGDGSKDRVEKASLGRGIPQTPDPVSRWVVKLDFVGANPNPRIAAADRTPAAISFFKGRKEHWKAGLSTYGSITYSDLWPRIDLVYSGTANRLKYTFLVKPGADPAQVRLAYRGAHAVRLNDAGQLEVETPAGVLQDDRPYAYQEVEGRRVEVSARYSLDRAPAGAPHGYGFAIGSYDRSKPLVLDPAVFVYAGYIGGISTDIAVGIAVDTAGNAYVTGSTASFEATFPVTVGPDLTSNGGFGDAFVAKVNAAGTGLLYCGYIGGDGAESGNGIAVDSSGNAYVTGFTSSTETTFPVTVGPDLTFNGGGSPYDAFVAKVNADGTALLYCGYIGGSDDDWGNSIAVDSFGNAYVTGNTRSTEATFPVTVGPDLTYNGGYQDAFLAKVNADGTALLYCGYIGGSGGDGGSGIAVDSSGNAYVTGYTHSTEATFPVSVGPDLTFNGNFEDIDAFVAKVNAGGTALLYCGYIGGSGGDGGSGIAVDSSGNAYVTGATRSTEATFPVIVGPDLTFNGGTFGSASDAFVAKVNAAGTALLYCGYIGGSEDDGGTGIAVDRSGNAYVFGGTGSRPPSFPATGGPDLTYNGGPIDAFVAKVNAAGTALVYCGYIGGGTISSSGEDYGYGIAVDGSGNAYVAGATTSTEATFSVTVGPDLTFNGGAYGAYDAFVAKITESTGVFASSDFDGDGLADKVIFRSSDGNWYVKRSDGVGDLAVQWGASGDLPAPGNYGGDGRADYAVFRPGNGTWYVRTAEGTTLPGVQWGTAGDIPVPGNYGGDARVDFAVWRPSNGTWYVQTAEGTSLPGVEWGTAGDIPVPGDFDGDAVTDLAIFRPSSGTWFVKLSGGETVEVSFGTAGDVPVAGDFTGDGRADFAIFRPSTGTWFVRPSSGGPDLASVNWGTAGDGALGAQMSGDLRADKVIWRPASGVWFVQSAEGSFPASVQWGTNGDIAMAR